MSRLLLLAIVGIWLIAAQVSGQPRFLLRPSFFLFPAGYIVLILCIALWARQLARQVINDRFRRNHRQFSHALFVAQCLVPLWLAFGLSPRIGWAGFVVNLCGQRYMLPGLLLGAGPALLTWIALWWAEYPADHALREQNVAIDAMRDMPVRHPPTVGRYMLLHLQQQLLLILSPILLIAAVRDGFLLAFGRFIGEAADAVMLPAALAVFIFAPVALKWLFDTTPLPDSILRRKLEEICRRNNVRYRQILLWRTDYSVANAAVIGMIPQLRYILLSDRLIETLTDEQIEAVFAHELGHIVHHHLAWFFVLLVTMIASGVGPGLILYYLVQGHVTQSQFELFEGFWAVASFAGSLWAISMIARLCERQADVFAARMMESEWNGFGNELLGLPPLPLSDSGTFVGPRGAQIFCSALERVASVNNMPVEAWDLLHPSIARRLRYVQRMSANPANTRRFDRLMSRFFMGIVIVLAVGIIVAVLLNM